MAGRFVKIGGALAAVGAGYYLYTAGGDPKVAQKQAEADAAKLSSKIKSDLPGKEKEAEKKGQELAQRAGSSFDKATADAKSALSDAEKKAEELRQKGGKEITKAIDKFDKEVTEGASKAKGWFGGK